jgi:hypothetical protein
MDAYSLRLVGYSIGERMTADLAVSALRNAIALRDPVKTIVHSDRGSQGEFNRSSQHPDTGGVDGQTIELGQGVHRKVGAEVTRCAVAPTRSAKTVLA